MVPVFSAASCRRRDVVIGRRTSSATTAPRLPNESPSSKAARTSSSLSASQKTTRSGWRPACAIAGKNRSGLVRHQRTFPVVLAAIPAVKRAAAAPSTVPAPPPATSCSAPNDSPPPGNRVSISSTPKGRVFTLREVVPSMRAIFSRKSSMIPGVWTRIIVHGPEVRVG